MPDLASDAIDSWRIADRVNRYLLDALGPEDLAAKAPDGKGRSVGEQIAHLHNVRLLWLKSAAPALAEGLEKVESKSAGDADVLRAALEASGDAIATMLTAAFEEGKVRGFKPHPTAFLAYLAAHEGHHRGQVILTLRLAGRRVDQKVTFGMWEWGVR